MINERIALVMLEGEIPTTDNVPDPHDTNRLYTAVQNFATVSLKLCEVGKTRKFEEYLKVASKLYKEGNETVKNAIINVYLFTISHAMDMKAQLAKHVERIFPKELMSVYYTFHYSSGL